MPALMIAAFAIAACQASIRNTFLETELIGMEMADQDVRLRWIAYMREGKQVPQAVIAEVGVVDKDNLTRMRAVVERYGWPTKSMVGLEASNSAFIVVQHLTSDLAFMKKCLRLMEPLLKEGEVEKGDFALLWDRTSLMSGGRQRYGSQVEAKNGRWVLQRCEDVAHLDQRRKQMGLPPIKEYLKAIEKVYGKAK